MTIIFRERFLLLFWVPPNLNKCKNHTNTNTHFSVWKFTTSFQMAAIEPFQWHTPFSFYQVRESQYHVRFFFFPFFSFFLFFDIIFKLVVQESDIWHDSWWILEYCELEAIVRKMRVFRFWEMIVSFRWLNSNRLSGTLSPAVSNLFYLNVL